jgi:hypothetical protein
MRYSHKISACLSLLIITFLLPASAQTPVKIEINWDRAQRISQTSPTLQVVPCPPLRGDTPVRANAYRAIRELGPDYVRFQPWFPFPRFAVAELESPKDGKTSWDFSLIDPMMIDFLEATKGHSVILDFATIPQWMFKTDRPVSSPSDPNQLMWNYEQGTELRDPTFKEVADYFARILSWYTKGGFTDELGQRHESGYHYSIPYWEVLNEPELEHRMSPQMYTRLYDEIVTAMRQVDPNIKFVGLALAGPSLEPEFFEYFLNHENHKPGIPLDFISYHFYAIPGPEETPEIQGYTFFADADGFLNTVRYVEAIRKRLSPETHTMLNEMGAILADDLEQGEPGHQAKPVPDSYWNLSSALYAYLFGELTHMGIDVAGASALIGYPRFFPSVAMVDWSNGKPNPRFRALELLHSNFGPGDKVMEVRKARFGHARYVYALPVINSVGKKRVLLVNKSAHAIEVEIAGTAKGSMEYVDQTTGSDPSAKTQLKYDTIKLNGFAVAAVSFP